MSLLRLCGRAILGAALAFLLVDAANAGGGGLTAGNPCPPQGSYSCGDPVNVANGELFVPIIDYTTAGPNALTLERYSNNQIVDSFVGWNDGFVNILTHFGNFRSNYDSFLFIPAGAPYVDAIMADDKNFHFVPDGKGGWIGPKGIDVQLAQSGTVWTLTDWNDNVYSFNEYFSSSNIELTSIKARNGYTRTVSYDAQFNLTAVTDSYGRVLKFSGTGCATIGYPDQCKTNSVTTPDGLVLTYTYTSSGSSAQPWNLTNVSYSTSPKTSQSYTYDPNFNFLNGIIDEDGDPLAAWTYFDALGDYGFATSSTGAGGANQTTFNWIDVSPKSTVDVVNALGQTTYYTCVPVAATPPGAPANTPVDVAAECPTASRLNAASAVEATQTTTFDSNLFIASQTDWNGNLTEFVNNARGEPLTVTQAAGTPQQRVITTSYHAKYRLPLQTVAPGLTTTYSYDANGNLLTLTQTDTTTTTAPYATKGQTRAWKYAWTKGLPVSITDPRGAVTKLAWSGTGALLSVTDALGHVTRITAHLPGGWPQAIVDPNGVTTDLSYDARQSLIGVVVHTAAGALTTTYARDAVGKVTSVTQPDGSRLTFTYDAAHRLTGVTDLFGQKIAYTLDGLGDTTKTSLLAAGGALARMHTAKFDTLGRLLQDIGGAGQTTTYTYDENGNALTITDPRGRVTTQSFDALDRVTKAVNPVKGVISFAYNAQDRPVSVTDPNGNVTRYVYDGFGDAIETVSPDTGATVVHYDEAGNATQKIDARGVVTNYSYDLLGRLTAKAYPASTGEDVSIGYDAAGAKFGIGHLTSMTDASGKLSLVYDERGNVVSETRAAPGATLVTGYGYDKASRLASITYPSGAELTYTRDAMGRITAASIKPAGGAALAVLSGVRYEPFGPVLAMTYGNGIAETRSYDADYRMTHLDAAGTEAVQKLSYGYNPENDVTAVTDGLNAGNSQAYTYDTLNRVITASATEYGAIGYAYDAVGNRLSETHSGTTDVYTYMPHGNRIAAIKEAGTTLRSFAYSADGNIVTDSRTTATYGFAYNHANRLASVTSSGAPVATYLYDGFGRRLVTHVTQAGVTATTLFQYDRAGHLIEEAHLPTTTGAAIQRLDYVYLDDRPVARLNVNTGELDFLHDDRLGTPQVVTHAAQKTVWSATYEPFGTATTAGAFVQNLRFLGQYADNGPGYSHNGFRDYDPTLGRYLESDPLGLFGGLNTYGYAFAQPADRTDPMGLSPADVCLEIFKYVGGQQADNLMQQALQADGLPNNPLLSAGASGAVLGAMEGGATGAVLGAPIGEGGGLTIVAGAIAGANVGFITGVVGALPGVLMQQYLKAHPQPPGKCLCKQADPKGQRQTGVPGPSVLDPGGNTTSYNGNTNGSQPNPSIGNTNNNNAGSFSNLF